MGDEWPAPRRIEGMLRAARGYIVVPHKVLPAIAAALLELEKVFESLGHYFNDDRWRDAGIMMGRAVRELRREPPRQTADREIVEGRELEDAKTQPTPAPVLEQREPVLHLASRRKGLRLVRNPFAGRRRKA